MSKKTSLAEFELYVMLAAARLGDEAYGASIRRAIETRTGRPVSIGAVYATLARLTDAGLLTSTVSEPLPVRGGRSRRFYALTVDGKATLVRSTQMLRHMIEGISLLDEQQ